uniref:AMP-binding domain-containing protein n=1 Tax=Caenorhabditis tropicalis TaxID=1561998 RepID=A0A1I7TF07_9PELO
MAFHVGCTLILTPDSFRSEPHRMQKAIEEFRPTIAQFTSIVFEMLPSPDSLLSATTSLRILLIGGSHFPLEFINSIRSSDNGTRVFNVYGVTEVSCWATCYEVEIGCSEVLIGDPIDGTTLEIDSDGQLILGGPRQCYVNGQKAEKHETGDRIERRAERGLKITGRMDRLVKHKGIRVCLDHLTEISIREHPLTYFIHFKNRNLIQFISGPTTSNDFPYTKTIELNQNSSVLVTVIRVPELPINTSGKIDENELKKICDQYFGSNGIRELKKLIEKKMNIRLEEVMDKSFVSIGINSLLAAELSIHFGKQQDEVMRKMLDDQITIRQILNSFDDFQEKETRKKSNDMIEIVQKRQPKMKWAVDLHKCIDGNMLIIRDTMLVCASHSGIIVAVNPKTGDCLWRTNCGVRFECTPILVNEEIVIGCKGRGLCFLNSKSGELLSIQEYEEGFGIRSECAFDEEFIYFTTENGYFHAVDPKNRRSVFRESIEKRGGGTSVGPLVFSDNSIFATTTSGCLVKIIKRPTFHISFTKQFGPIFSKPLILDGNSLLITSVHGVLTIVNAENGKSKDTISLDNENCFCSPMAINEHLLVATQSGKCVLLNTVPKLQISKVFQFDLPGISFVKPLKLIGSYKNSHELLMMSKNGWILFAHLRNLNQFENVTAYPISNKEVFTSPEIIENENERIVLIAGRDDYLRAFYF